MGTTIVFYIYGGLYDIPTTGERQLHHCLQKKSRCPKTMSFFRVSAVMPHADDTASAIISCVARKERGAVAKSIGCADTTLMAGLRMVVMCVRSWQTRQDG